MLAARGIEPPFLVYAFGIRVLEQAIEAARASGIGVFDARGEWLAPKPMGS